MPSLPLLQYAVIYSFGLSPTLCLYTGRECIQKCPKFFEVIDNEAQFEKEVEEGNPIMTMIAEHPEMNIWKDRFVAPRCQFVGAMYYWEYEGKQKRADDDITNDNSDQDMWAFLALSVDTVSFYFSLDTTNPESPQYCMLNSTTEEDPQWLPLQIKDTLCEKAETVDFCNFEWPCVTQGLAEVCDYHGSWNCTSESCDCFHGFVDTPNRERPADNFTSCDIGIRALFNDTLPALPDDFIKDGKLLHNIIDLAENEYKLPQKMIYRVWSQAYLVEEFNQAINDVDNMFFPEANRQEYLRFSNQSDDPFVDQNSTLLISIQMTYRDYDIEDAPPSEGLSTLVEHVRQGLDARKPSKKVRSNRPGWIAINGHGIYVVGDRYWLMNRSSANEDIPAPEGIGYTLDLTASWYTARSFEQFKTMGKLKLTMKLAEELSVSTLDIAWTKITQETEPTSFNAIYEALVAISAESGTGKEALDYFVEKGDKQLILEPQGSEQIKTALAAREISIGYRKKGGIIVSQYPWPTPAQGAPIALNEQEITDKFQEKWAAILQVPKDFVRAEKNGALLVLTVFVEHVDSFGRKWARMQDKEDPVTKYKDPVKFEDHVKEQMVDVTPMLNIGFPNFQVTSSKTLYATLYEVSIFATDSEIASKQGITDVVGKQYMDQFRDSLWDGFANPNPVPNVYLMEKVHPGEIFTAELKIQCTYPGRLQTAEKAAVPKLYEVSKREGWGKVDKIQSTATAKISIFVGIFTDEGKTGNPEDYLTGGKDEKMMNLLRDLVTSSDENVNMELMEAKTTSQPSILDLTFELWLNLGQEEHAEKIFDTVKGNGFVKSAQRKAMAMNLNVQISEIRIIYPAALAKDTDTLITKSVVIQQSAVDFGREMEEGDPSNGTFLETEGQKIFPRFMGYWPVILPMDVFCTEFHTALRFGTQFVFGYFKQYLCVQLTNMIPGQGGKVLLKTQLIYKPVAPGAPDGLSQLCDYNMKKKTGEEYQPDPEMDDVLEKKAPHIGSTCSMLAAAKELLPDNLPWNAPNVMAMLGAQVVVQELPDLIVTDPRPNPKYPSVQMMKTQGGEIEENATYGNATGWETSYDSQALTDKIPEDAIVVGVILLILIILAVIRKFWKRRQLRKQMLAGVAEDMDEMNAVALSSRLNANELKQVLERAKERVKEMDFSAYKKKKRKQAWAALEKLKQKHEREKEREQRFKDNKKRFSDSLLEEKAKPEPEEEEVEESSDEYEFDDLFEQEDTESSFDDPTGMRLQNKQKQSELIR